MRGLALETIAILIITAAVIAVGIALVLSSGTGLKDALPGQISDGISKSIQSLLPFPPTGKASAAFNLCEGLTGQLISHQDFLVLLTAMAHGQCESALVSINFAMTEQELVQISEQIGTKNTVFDIEEPLGAGFLVVNGNPGYYPLTLGDRVNVTLAGEPENDIVITVDLKGCDPNDSSCDLSCVYEPDYTMADPLCYGTLPDGKGACDFKSVDTNRDQKIDTDDLDGICDPDCYNNYTNPSGSGKAFDPDCTQSSINPSAPNDNICDPDSNGVTDGVCDNDCSILNTICDPDCAGHTACICGSSDPANPRGIDGFCSPVCQSQAGYPFNDNDWDCRVQTGNTWVPGDGLCHSGRSDEQGRYETCDISPDCPSLGMTCAQKYATEPMTCAPLDTRADSEGCSPSNQPENASCTIDAQCSAGLKCSSSHCCPDGKSWDGTQCKGEQPTLRVLVVPLNWGSSKSSFESAARTIHSYYLDRLPLKSCPQQYKALVPDMGRDYGDLWNNGYCDASDQVVSPGGCYLPGKVEFPDGTVWKGVLERIQKCGEQYRGKTGEDWDFAVGIDDSDIEPAGISRILGTWTAVCGAGGVGGWSDGEGGTPSVIVETLDIEAAAGITAHELGHEFAFGEQYCDCTGLPLCGDTHTEDCGAEICGTNHPVNPLRASLGCGGKGTICERRGSLGNNCDGRGVPVFGNRDRFSSAYYSSQNNNDGQRSVMSNLILNPATKQLSGHYSIDEWNVLTSDPKTSCRTP